MFRVGNRRSNMIVQTQLRVSASFTQITAEGDTFYKQHDLKLVRDRHLGAAPRLDRDARDRRAEPVLRARRRRAREGRGRDRGLADRARRRHVQTVHSIHLYTDKQIVFDRRFADTLTPLPER